MKKKLIYLKNVFFGKTLKIMKISFFLFFVGVFQVFAANNYAQGKKLTLSMENTTIAEALQAIEDQSEFKFFYNNQLVDVEQLVTVKAKKDNIWGVLDQVLPKAGITYYVVGKQVALFSDTPGGNKDIIQQPQTVTGTVTDENGEPLPGLSIIIKGTTDGTVTNLEGGYSIEVEGPSTVLVFSFIGYITQEVIVGEQTVIDINLGQDILGLEEVVVIGYGTQKRTNITGSVATAGEESIEGEPVATASQALQGDISGVTIRQMGGQPGAESSEIRIRGYGTFSSAGNDPLVLIDGITGSIDDVNPSDIKNISVLKDAASAAIYGARAANGVILVETKRGKAGKMEISYNGYVGFSELADSPQFVDSWNYALAYNEGLENMGLGTKYSEEDIQKFMSGEDPDNYPNDDHYQMAFDNKAFQTKHDLTMSGGNSTTSYLFSVGYLRNDGILQNNIYDNYNDNLLNYYNQYTTRLNVDSKLSKKVHLRVNMSGRAGDDHAPGAFTGDKTMERLVTRITRMSAALPARTSDGWYGRVDRGCPWGAIDSETHELDKTYHFMGNVDLEYNIFGPITLIGRAGYNLNSLNYRKYVAEMQVTPDLLQTPSKLWVDWNNSRERTLEALAKYDQSFENHEIHVLAGFSQIAHSFNYLSAFRDGFPTNELYELNVASSENQTGTSGATEWALVSYFGRLQYAYMGKYLFEANARYDGSSRFGTGNKFGLFPSFSLGWRVSEEQFIKDGLPWIYNLKLRGSWGELGNQQIGAYPYQATMSTGANYVLGNEVYPGAAITTVANEDITWETTRIIDVGLDFSVFKGKLALSVDYFDKKTSDILYNITTAGVLGLNSSPVNAGEVANKGWDFSLRYKNSHGDLSYSITPNFLYVDTEVLSLAGVEKDIQQGLFIGEPLNAIYGYVADGLYVDQQDIDNSPEQAYVPAPGDIKYKDISGPDGVPDGVVDAEYDRTVIGQTSPKYNYGAQFAVNYKGFDFSLTVHGAAGMKRNLENYAARAFANKSNVQQWMWDNRWTTENPDPNAIYPRFFHHGEGRSQPYAWYSTFWSWDASYLKIKSVQIGYTLPSSLTNALNISSMRLYISGRNLYTFDNYYPGWDPEIRVESAQGGRHYPMTRTYVFGVNVKF